MNISIEKIDTIIERTGIGYVDAKDALEKNNHDLVEALVYLEQQNKIKKNYKRQQSKMKELVADLNAYRFVVTKNERTVVDLSLVFSLFFALITTPVFLLSLLIGFLTNHTFSIQKELSSPLSVEVSDQTQHRVDLQKKND